MKTKFLLFIFIIRTSATFAGCTLTMLSTTPATNGCNGKAMVLFTNCTTDCLFNYYFSLNHHQHFSYDTLFVDSLCIGHWSISTYCDSDMVVWPIDITTHIAEQKPAQSFFIYPNPLTSSSILQLNTQVTNAEVIIYDMVGKEIMRKKLTGDKMEIEKGSLEQGVYFVRVVSDERQWVEKLVVE